MRRLLIVGLVAILVPGCGSGGDSGLSTTAWHDEVGRWLAAVDEPPAHSWDLYFGALMLSDDLFFQDEEGELCFTTAFARELATAGPELVVTTLSEWTTSGKEPGSSWDDLVALFNSVGYEDRVQIGDAVANATDDCGGLLERALAVGRGPSLLSCYIEFYERHDAIPEVVAASLELNSNAKAETGEESAAFFESIPAEDEAELASCYEGLDAARAAYQATTTEAPSPADACDSVPGYGYLKADQEWYMSARSVNQEPEVTYHARVWGERETWLSNAGIGRNHQVTHGPGFDTTEAADAWLDLGAPEPLEMGILTFDVAVDAGDIRVVDLECLASLDNTDARRELEGEFETDAQAAFDQVVRALRHRGGLSEEALAFAYQYLTTTPGVEILGRDTDHLGREGVALALKTESPHGPARHVALIDPATYALLEYREEQHSQPPWTDRTVPFLSRRETVLASGFAEAVGETPPGVDGVQDPDRPEGTTDVPAVQSVEPQLTCGRLRLLGLSYSEAVVYWFLHNRPANLDLNGTGIPCDNTFDGQSIDAFWPQLPLLPVDELESGLFCRDLDARSYAYPNVVAYWFREGKPDRMDADRNGIPCEALYDPIEIESFFGDPAPTTTTITTTWFTPDPSPAYAPPTRREPRHTTAPKNTPLDTKRLRYGRVKMPFGPATHWCAVTE